MNIINNTQQISILLSNLSGLKPFNKTERDFLFNKTKKIELDCSIIRKCAFRNFKYLEQVSFPKCIDIGDYAFGYCPLLSEASFPQCQNIKEGAFQGCALQSVNLPECISIGNNAFSGCEYLQRISLPKCNLIGSYAFDGCISLKSIFLMNSSVCTLSSYAFNNTPFTNLYPIVNSPRIYVPSSLVTEYQNNAQWSYYSSYFVGVLGGTE